MWKQLAVVVVVFGVVMASEADVLDLGDDDFSTRVAEADTTLVMFYAPW